MGFILKDRVQETSTTTGTGNFTLAGATNNERAFSSVCSVGDTFWYAIINTGSTEWETGVGTYSSANTLTRTSILDSSNSGSVVSFSAGTKNIFITLPASKAVPGQLQGTSTNDNANSGNVGEVVTSGSAGVTQTTVTATISTPGVVAWASHGMSTGMPFYLSTTGALPTGLSANTNYYAIPIDANSLWFASSAANAIAGIKIATSGSQSGTHTAYRRALLANGTPACINVLTLTAGDYMIYGFANFSGDSATTVRYAIGEINTAEAAVSQVPGTFGKISGYGPSGSESAMYNLSSGYLVTAGPRRIPLASTANIYLNVLHGFSTATAFANGSLLAQRIR